MNVKDIAIHIFNIKKASPNEMPSLALCIYITPPIWKMKRITPMAIAANTATPVQMTQPGSFLAII